MNGPDKMVNFHRLIDFAEKHGFVDNITEDKWSAVIAEALETAALEYLIKHKVPFVYDGE
jgi:hypothetical protein|tara:strand:- start:33 stop:212 length:180 start_codon:yes stop_codon:yes gene_type:complete